MSNLTQRVFLMRNVHEDAPVLMKTRWALSYLRGPLTGPEIARVMASKKQDAREVANALDALRSSAGKIEAQQASRSATPVQIPSASRPVLGAGIANIFSVRRRPPGELTTYKPMVAGFAKLHYVDSKLGLDDWRTAAWLAPFADGSGEASWEDGLEHPLIKDRLLGNPAGHDVEFADLPAKALRAASYPRGQRAFRLISTKRRAPTCSTATR